MVKPVISGPAGVANKSTGPTTTITIIILSNLFPKGG
jgi:hypothetical protein